MRRVENVRAVLFDIDGTLLTTGGAGAAAWRLAFRDVIGIDAEIEDFTEDGITDPEVCRKTFQGVTGRTPTHAEVAALLPAYVKHLHVTVRESEGYRVMPGVAGLLGRLSDDGVLLGVTTGNVEAAAHVKLARARLNHFFMFGGFGSDSPDRGELTRDAIVRAGRVLGAALSREQVLVVGDTPHDVEAAREADAGSVAVATGHFDRASLVASGADHVLATLRSGFPV